MKKLLNSERGITLPELLAVFVILGILGTIIISVLLSGFKTQARIQIESDLRDEADIIMAELISDFYTLKSSEIEQSYLHNADTNDSYIELIDNRKLGFIDGKVHLKNNTTSSLSKKKIKLDTHETKIEAINEEKGLYHITLKLIYAGEESKQTLKTESEIGIIMDGVGGE